MSFRTRFHDLPIKNLAEVMRGISKEQNYEVRAEVMGNDETGILAQAFNDMLGRIQERDGELAQHRAHLEEEVTKRTEGFVEA